MHECPHSFLVGLIVPLSYCSSSLDALPVFYVKAVGFDSHDSPNYPNMLASLDNLANPIILKSRPHAGSK